MFDLAGQVTGQLFAETPALLQFAAVRHQLDAQTLEASVFPTSGELPSDAINGVHTLFQYLPKLGGYAYQPRHDAVMHFVATQ